MFEASMSSALSESLAARVRSFEGGLYCHAPGDRPFDVEALARDDDGEDRWSTPGTSTIYLAGDPLVATAEYARHGPRDGRDDQRRLVELPIRAVRLLDVRDRAVQAALGDADHPIAWLDIGRAREAARRIREAGICDGLIVPSMAFVDREDVFNVVLFRESIDGPLGSALGAPREVGRIELSARNDDREEGGRAETQPPARK
ncbi:MAG TPA: RES family NAD+ phosphorylase [Candidatus Limnocylindrales bacterium]|jgi:RES domain-containing protein|nr:RES family NAD+ phosphorylase [Candidatus Limnocylindrales bacterium]